VPGRSALREHGAVKVMAYCTHPVLSGRAVERINGSVLERSWSRHHPARRQAAVQPEDPAAVLRGAACGDDFAHSREDSVSSLFIE